MPAINLKVISASSFKTDDLCRWKLFLQRELKFSDTSSAAALMGTMCHHVFQTLSQACLVKHDKKSKIWNIEYLWNIVVNHYYNELPEIAAQIDAKKLEKCAIGLFKMLDGPYSPINDNILSVEESFYIPLKHKEFKLSNGEYFSINGRMDMVVKLSNDTIELRDYKSGSNLLFGKEGRPEMDSIHLHDEIQARLYHLALRELYPQYKNVIVTFIYFVQGGPVSVPFTDADIPKTIDIIRKKFLAIKTDEDPNRNVGWHCKCLCGFSKNGVCDQVWAEKNKYGVNFVRDKYTVLNAK